MNSQNNDDLPTADYDDDIINDIIDEDPDYIVTINDLYNLNENATGGVVFVRDDHLLRSAVRRPFIAIFGVPQFPTLIDKAAALMHSVAAHHLFVDGNKRTAEQVARLFLEANGITPTWDSADIRPFLLAIARGEHDVGAVAHWLRKHSQPVHPS